MSVIKANNGLLQLRAFLIEEILKQDIFFKRDFFFTLVLELSKLYNISKMC